MDWAEIVLRVHDVSSCARFYEQALGMRRVSSDAGVLLRFPTSAAGEASLRLAPSERFEPTVATPNDAFWKLGITVDRLDLAVERLRSRGVEVTEPAQFRDIGYLCHLRDPSGHALELLQTTFEGRATAPSSEDALGSHAVLAHLTLRVRRLAEVLRFWETQGLHLVSRQPVPDIGFTLYFLATRIEPRPVEDLEAVENREWLWQRRYTCLELQHWPDREVDFDVSSGRDPGFERARFRRSDGSTLDVALGAGDGFTIRGEAGAPGDERS